MRLRAGDGAGLLRGKRRLARESSLGGHPTSNDFNWLAKQQISDSLAAAAQRYAAGRLLDIGCGEKPYETTFFPYVTEHVGVDHPESPHALTSVDVVASAYDVPLGDESFDTVLMSELLEHLEKPGAALDEARRLLRPGGWIILTTPFMWVLHEEPRDFFRYSPFGLEALLRHAGFDAVSVTPIGGQWSTLALLMSYALRDSRLRSTRADVGRRLAGTLQECARRIERRQAKTWMSWNHLAVGRRPERIN